jgi:hypothetical protein
VAASLDGSGFKGTIDFMASMGFTGGLVAGTLAWFFQLVDRNLGAPRKIDIAQWTAYGALLGGWMGLIVFLVSSIVTPIS